MTGRLLLCVAFVANILVLVACTETTSQVLSENGSSASETSSLMSTKTVKSRPKCRRVKRCPRNEEYSFSPESIQRAQYCSEKAVPSTNRSTSRKPCERGCVCKENYLRAENGTCIPAAQCPVICGANEILDNCPTNCQSDHCPTEEDREYKPCIVPDVCPPPVCKCAFNHRRASNGSCIPTKECPPYACGTNEEYNPCPPLCPTDDCSQASPSGECPPLGRIGIILPCNPKCRCIKDYWRLDGICVPYGQCPGVCPANERYSTCTQAECRALNCTQKGQPIPCIRMDPTFCKTGCVCKEGYLRNDDGICVLEDKCEPGVCPANERYSTCIQAGCRALNCTQKSQPVPCIRLDPKFCQKGCVCKEGYLRNDDGICVLEDKCKPPSCTSANEEFVTCMQGVCRAKDCSQKGEDVPCPDIPREQCDSGCICKEHFLRAANGSCVPEDQCEPGVCPANERYSTCTQVECRALNCTQKGQSVPCIDIIPQYCKKGCVCKEGYLRNKDGICVLEDKCELAPSCTSANEEFVACMQGVCRAKDCSQKGEDVPCPDIPREQCDSGCICKEHFLRAANGSCVPEDQCEPNKCRLFEVWDNCANAACRAEYCTQKGFPVPCPSVTKCLPGCLCRPDYLRNADGFCVPENDCNTPKTCGENEVLDNCSLSCNSDKCPQSADEEQVCTQSDPCIPACKCKFNYRRSENGTCIPTRDCPPFDCSAKPNEEYVACPPFCPIDECSKPRLEGRCPFNIGTFLQCNPKCQCKDGYGRVNGTCVPFDKCPGLCPTNEVYSSCVQQTCRQQNCSDRDVAMKSCPSCDEASCQRGCVCQENYYRNDKGVCVPYDECEAPKICGENEVLDNCPIACNSDDCPQSADEKQVCTEAEPCIPACKCRFNYKRAVNGTCIRTSDCPPFDCSAKPNEEFVACPPLCPTDECGKPRLDGRCPFRIGILLNCNPKCQCKDGYGRVNGTCVPFEQCPGLCPTNEVYSSCVQRTCRQQNCSDRDVAMKSCPSCDEASCQRGCVCQENYYRNDKGVCVPYDECEAGLCPTNEVYSSCVQQICRQQKCADRDLVMETCPSCDKASCHRGCVCQKNYYRNDKGVCVSYEQCGGPICPNAHEKYKPDFKECPPNICNSLVAKHPCDENQKEGPGCVCESGYLRINVTSPCIPICDCPEMKHSIDCY